MQRNVVLLPLAFDLLVEEFAPPVVLSQVSTTRERQMASLIDAPTNRPQDIGSIA